jgi:flagellar motor switch protein FliN/FliY
MTSETDPVEKESADALPPEASLLELPELSGAVAPTEVPSLDQLQDVELDVRVDLGRTYMRIEDVMKLEPGVVVPLDKAAEEPVDIFVGGRLIARGEILVIDGCYGIRVAELVSRMTVP